MPLTEDDLRALLRDRTASVPPTPGLAGRVEQRGRRRRRVELVTGVAALVLVLVGAALVAVPHRQAAPPVGPTPTPSPSVSGRTVVTSQSVGDLDVTTEGPARIDGGAPFTLRLTVSNTGARAWSGVVAIGVVGDAVFPGWYDGGLITAVGGFDQYSDLGATLPELTMVGGKTVARAFSGVSPRDSQTIEAGQTRTWVITAGRDAATAVPGDVAGWVPYLGAVGADSPFGDVDMATPVTVAPIGSSLPCATVSIDQATPGTAGPWQFSEVAAATAGTSKAASWKGVTVDAEPMDLSSSATGDVRPTTVARAIADRGVGRPSAFGPSAAPRPRTLAPGRYVTYGAYTLLPITFTATCAPSGTVITGTWKSYDAVETGLVDCSTSPPKGTLGAEVKQRFCPR